MPAELETLIVERRDGVVTVTMTASPQERWPNPALQQTGGIGSL